MSWLRMGEVFTVFGLCELAVWCTGAKCARWLDRRRVSRRSAMARRRRARAAHHATAIGRDEFRAQTRGYLLELRQRDDIAAIAAGIDYVRRASSGPADAA